MALKAKIVFTALAPETHSGDLVSGEQNHSICFSRTSRNGMKSCEKYEVPHLSAQDSAESLWYMLGPGSY